MMPPAMSDAGAPVHPPAVSDERDDGFGEVLARTLDLDSYDRAAEVARLEAALADDPVEAERWLESADIAVAQRARVVRVLELAAAGEVDEARRRLVSILLGENWHPPG